MNLKEILPKLEEGILHIPDERKEALRSLKKMIDEVPNVAFICTHNSRRSQIAEIWIDMMSDYMALDLKAYSAGTEATELNPRVVKAWKEVGLQLKDLGPCNNPRYMVEGVEKRYYSKTFQGLHASIGADFIAIMVCDDADTNCPFVPGAKHRFSLTYTDPKHADGKENELEVYVNKIWEIGSEMWFMLHS